MDKSVNAYESSIDMLVPKDARPYVAMYADWRDRMDWQERKRLEHPEDYE